MYGQQRNPVRDGVAAFALEGMSDNAYYVKSAHGRVNTGPLRCRGQLSEPKVLGTNPQCLSQSELEYIGTYCKP